MNAEHAWTFLYIREENSLDIIHKSASLQRIVPFSFILSCDPLETHNLTSRTHKHSCESCSVDSFLTLSYRFFMTSTTPRKMMTNSRMPAITPAIFTVWSVCFSGSTASGFLVAAPETQHTYHHPLRRCDVILWGHHHSMSTIQMMTWQHNTWGKAREYGNSQHRIKNRIDGRIHRLVSSTSLWFFAKGFNEKQPKWCLTRKNKISHYAQNGFNIKMNYRDFLLFKWFFTYIFVQIWFQMYNHNP